LLNHRSLTESVYIDAVPWFLSDFIKEPNPKEFADPIFTDIDRWKASAAWCHLEVATAEISRRAPNGTRW
jgi:hypothetical protein